MKTIFAIMTAAVMSFLPLLGQEQSTLLDNKTRDLLHESLSGELAKEHVYQITSTIAFKARGSTEMRPTMFLESFEAMVSPKRMPTSRRSNRTEKLRTKRGSPHLAGIFLRQNCAWSSRTTSGLSATRKLQ